MSIRARIRENLAWIGLLSILYTITRYPLMMSHVLPDWYHWAVQRDTFLLAIDAAKHSLFDVLVSFPYSGGNVHAIFAAPLVLLGGDVRWIRFVMFLSGILTILLFADILNRLGANRLTIAFASLLLIFTPHFAIFTGMSLPEPVTLLFSVASINAYLRYLADPRRLWAGLSGLSAGFAAFNHFWGGIATVTVLWIDGYTTFTSSSTYEDMFDEIRMRWPVWFSHIAFLIPAGILYSWYQLTGRTGPYSKLFITESWDLLLTFSWFRKMFTYSWVYSPAVLSAGLVFVLLVGIAVRRSGLLGFSPERWTQLFGIYAAIAVGIVVLTGFGSQFLVLSISVAAIMATYSISQKRETAIHPEWTGNLAVPRPEIVFSVWILCGGLVLVLYPLGSLVHEYYFWWLLVPGVALTSWVLEYEVSRFSTAIKLGLVIVLVISTAFTGLNIGRSYVSPDSETPLSLGYSAMCFQEEARYSCKGGYQSMTRERHVGERLAEVYQPGDTVLITGPRRTRLTIQILAEIPDVAVVRRESLEPPLNTDIVVTSNSTLRNRTDWVQLGDVSSGKDGTMYLFKRSQTTE